MKAAAFSTLRTSATGRSFCDSRDSRKIRLTKYKTSTAIARRAADCPITTGQRFGASVFWIAANIMNSTLALPSARMPHSITQVMSHLRLDVHHEKRRDSQKGSERQLVLTDDKPAKRTHGAEASSTGALGQLALPAQSIQSKNDRHPY